MEREIAEISISTQKGCAFLRNQSFFVIGEILMSTTQTPAESLLGKTLNGGWRVIEAFPLSPNATGGVFSVGYIVEAPDGTRGFLKALDYTRTIGSADLAEAMKS